MPVLFGEPRIHDPLLKQFIDDLKQLITHILESTDTKSTKNWADSSSEPDSLKVLPVHAIPEIRKLAHRYLGFQRRSPACGSRSRSRSRSPCGTPRSNQHEGKMTQDKKELLMADFFYTIWNTIIPSFLSRKEQPNDFMRVQAEIYLIYGLQTIPVDEDDIIQWPKLPLLHQRIRDLFNGEVTLKYQIPVTNFYRPDPIGIDWVDPIFLSSLETQRALAGLGSTTQKDIVPLVKQRNDWLSLQHFCASLWLHCGRDEYALYALWIIRDGLEDWPNDPPSFSSIPGTYENSPAYHVLNVEAALVWIIKVAELMYREIRVWGQNGNPNWPVCSGAPGKGGARWHGVDGYDIDHARWDLWKDVLQKIVEWCDQEESKGITGLHKLKNNVLDAVVLMEKVDSSFASCG
ncbi:hypothetical protein RhiJN_18280 [Ceratobasidium sp. AG-Ba]|nr:hypothetical protein RhiJN_18280 [Ceratobasidium sp. AG-Ba]